MPRLARYWDSLENDDNFFEIKPTNHPSKDSIGFPQKKWLESLKYTRDEEQSTILYAKPILSAPELSKNVNDDEDDDDDNDAEDEEDDDESKSLFSYLHNKLYFDVKKRVSSDNKKKRKKKKKKRKDQMLSTSLGSLPSHAPPKPQRKFIHKTSGAASAGSLPRLSKKSADYGSNSNNKNNNNKSNKTLDIINGDMWSNINLPGFRGDLSKAVGDEIQRRASSVSSARPPPPTYEQFRMSRQNSVKSLATTSSMQSSPIVRNKRSSTTKGDDSMENSVNTIIRSPLLPQRANSVTSVDSGQCSGDPIGSLCSSIRREESGSSSDDPVNDQQKPSYPRLASTMDHVLRTSSALHAFLATPTQIDMNMCRDMLAKSSVLLQLVETSPCKDCLPRDGLIRLKEAITEGQRIRQSRKGFDANWICNKFPIALRSFIESVLQLFIQIICQYLIDCSAKARLLSVALEHLIHICLFGDELCIEAIRLNAITSCVRILNSPEATMNEQTCRFALRTLAVLCGVSKGSTTLLMHSGWDMVLEKLLESESPMCSVEAAGILTQLTNPQSPFVRVNHIQPIVARLLDLIEYCNTGEALLLTTAALNNVLLQHPNGVPLIYRNNLIRRFINAYNRDHCATIFVQEQIVTAFSRLAAHHCEKQLVECGAIPVLLEFLSLTHPIHVEYCKRIRYKAAVCIGTLASTDVGIKAIYENQGYAILSNVLYDNKNASNPFNMICSNIRTLLEEKYKTESAV